LKIRFVSLVCLLARAIISSGPFASRCCVSSSMSAPSAPSSTTARASCRHRRKNDRIEIRRGSAVPFARVDFNASDRDHRASTTRQIIRSLQICRLVKAPELVDAFDVRRRKHEPIKTFFQACLGELHERKGPAFRRAPLATWREKHANEMHYNGIEPGDDSTVAPIRRRPYRLTMFSPL
jgi:hypothetical protein